MAYFQKLKIINSESQKCGSNTKPICFKSRWMLNGSTILQFCSGMVINVFNEAMTVVWGHHRIKWDFFGFEFFRF
jgi:hypothetical protein